jgi:hypothetical protein
LIHIVVSLNKDEHGLSHSGKVRNVISTTRCNLSRLARLPVSWLLSLRVSDASYNKQAGIGLGGPDSVR